MAAPANITPARAITPVRVATDSNRISRQLDATSTPGSVLSNLAVSETHQLISNIGALQTITIPLPGISYYFEFLGTTGGIPNNFSGLQVRAINRGQPRAPLIHVQGTGLRFGTQTFSGLEITNLDAANTARFTVDIGGGIPNNSYDEYIDKRLIIQQGGTGGTSTIQVSTAVGVNLSVVPGLTTIVGFKTRDNTWADSLAGGATKDVTDGYLGKTRKSVTFTNDDLAAVLLVLDTNGNTVGSVQPATAYYMETGGDIKLNNPTGGAVVCHIGEVYFS